MIGEIFFKRALVGATALTVSVAGVVGSSATSFAATPTAASTSAGGGGASATTPAKDRRDGSRYVAELVRNTSKETGLDAKTVRKDLASGQSFNQIAGDKASAVEQDVMTDLKARLDKAVASGKITQAQEDAALAKARPAVEKVMAADLSKYFSHSNGQGNGGGHKNSHAF